MRRRGRGGRFISVALLSGAAATLLVEAYGWWQNDVWQSITLGAAWAGVNANSLVGFGAFVEQSISPWLWSAVLVPLLTLPLWLHLALPGVALFALAGRRRRRRRRRSYFH